MHTPEPIERYLEPSQNPEPVPWIYRVAARIESVDVRKFDADPDILERTLRTVVELFDIPMVAVPFDPTVIAEAMGCEIAWSEVGPDIADGCVETVDDAFELPIEDVTDAGRVPATIEAVSRLETTLSGRAVLAAVPGPAHLTDILTNDEPSHEVYEETLWSAGDAIVEAARGYLDAGADALVVLEPAGVPNGDVGEILDPILNVVDYYNTCSFLVTRSLDGTTVNIAEDVGFDIVTGHPGPGFSGFEKSIVVGYGEPVEHFTDNSGFTAVPDGFGFLTSQWEVPSATSVERVHQFMDNSGT